MKAMQCELCGGTEIVKDGDFFVCQSCGMKYTLETARKMMVEGVVEVKGTVKQDRSDELVRLLELARGGLDSSNFKNAESYAMRALEIDLNNGKAWAIKAEAIDWQMTLADEREAETAQARFEMYKLLRETTDNIADILDATEVISKHEKHVKRIVQAEAILFTEPLEKDPGAKTEGYAKTLTEHLKFRKTEFESMQTLAKLWRLQAEKVVENSEALEPDQKTALDECLKTLVTITESAQRSISEMYFEASSKLSLAGLHGYTAATNKWADAINRLGINGSKSAKETAFDRYTYACDACVSVYEMAVTLLHDELVSKYQDKKFVDDLLLRYYKNMADIEDSCIDHDFNYFINLDLYTWQLTDSAKEGRRKKLRTWDEAAEAIKEERRHSPQIMELRKKMDEATQTPEFRQYVRDRIEFERLKKEWEIQKNVIFNKKRTEIAKQKKDKAFEKVDAFQKSEAWSQIDKWDDEAVACGVDKFVIMLESDAGEAARRTLVNWFGFSSSFKFLSGYSLNIGGLLKTYQCARVLEEFGVSYSIL